MTTSELRERREKVQSQCVQAVNGLMTDASGHPYAHIVWPHRSLHSGREAIEALQVVLDATITELEARDREIAALQEVTG